MNYMNWAGINSFFLIFLLFTSPLGVCSYQTFSHNETEPGLKIYQLLDYQNGTTVVFLTKAINDTCNEPRIDLRVIHQDGAVDKVNVDHSIPDFNFCLKPNDTSLHIRLFNKLNNIIILYENSTDVNFASFYTLIVDAQTGNHISNSFISKVSLIYGQLSHSASIYPHVNEDSGFLFRTFLTQTKMLLIYFNNPDQNGDLEIVNRNELELYSKNKFDIFAAVNGHFGLVTSNITVVPSRPPSELTPRSLFFYLFLIKPAKDAFVDEPSILYRSEKRIVQSDFACDFGYINLGYSCILNLKEPQAIGEPIDHFVKLDFKTSGSVVNTDNLDLKYNNDLGKIINLINLYHGGYLVTSLKNSNDINNKTTIQATVFNNDGIYNSTLLPEGVEAPNNGFQISFFQNNTLAVPKQEDMYNWKIITAEYPKFVSYDNGCDIPFVESVYPPVNSQIPLSFAQISFTYEFPISISSNNIAIYQNNNGKSILRQSVQASKFVPQSADNRTLSIQVLDSTFNQPNSEYYVVVDDDVSQEIGTDEPLTGIKRNIWKFNTTGNQYTIDEDVTGLFALTAEGTKYYDDLPRRDQKAFLAQLKIDLSESIPVDINRLSNVRVFQHDRSNDLPRIILTMSIKSTKNKNEPNVGQILRDLNTLIKQRDITIISRLNTTMYLNGNFGFSKIRNLFDDFKAYINGFVIGIAALILFYMFVKAIYPKGDNVVIIKNPLIFMNFILNILFIAMDANHVKDLYNFSIMFFIIPIIANIIMTMTIIFREIAYNESFYKWFMSNLVTSSICMILSIVDIEILSTLFSKVGGIMYFNAPVDKMRRNLFWGGLVALAVKDIPQFAIQVYYFLSFLISSYDIVAFLSFSICSLVLISKLSSKVYYIIYYIYKKRGYSKISPGPKIIDSCLITIPEPAVVRDKNFIQR